MQTASYTCQTSAPDSSLAAVRPLRGVDILVVEDEALLALDLASTIREAGARVEGPICRLEQAMTYSEIGNLDAALLDVDIAGDEVFEFADRLNASRVPIVFHTGRTDVARLMARYPNAEIVSKPCMARGLVAALTTAIRQHVPVRRAAS